MSFAIALVNFGSASATCSASSAAFIRHSPIWNRKVRNCQYISLASPLDETVHALGLRFFIEMGQGFL
jgi:hypothetical protein